MRSRYCRWCGSRRVLQKTRGGMHYYACPECEEEKGGGR